MSRGPPKIKNIVRARKRARPLPADNTDRGSKLRELLEMRVIYFILFRDFLRKFSLNAEDGKEKGQDPSFFIDLLEQTLFHSRALFPALLSVSLVSAPNGVLFSFQMPVNSHWTQTQLTYDSLCLRTTERQQRLKSTSRILITQRDLTTGSRCWEERL